MSSLLEEFKKKLEGIGKSRYQADGLYSDEWKAEARGFALACEQMLIYLENSYKASKYRTSEDIKLGYDAKAVVELAKKEGLL